MAISKCNENTRVQNPWRIEEIVSKNIMNGACTAPTIAYYRLLRMLLIQNYAGFRRYFEIRGLISEGEYILRRP